MCVVCCMLQHNPPFDSAETPAEETLRLFLSDGAWAWALLNWRKTKNEKRRGQDAAVRFYSDENVCDIGKNRQGKSRNKEFDGSGNSRVVSGNPSDSHARHSRSRSTIFRWVPDVSRGVVPDDEIQLAGHGFKIIWGQIQQVERFNNASCPFHPSSHFLAPIVPLCCTSRRY